MPRNHLYIAGTGRAGTTFLVRYLTALGLDTTLSRRPQMQDNERANAGIEVAPEHLDHEDSPYVIKSPWLYLVIDDLLDKGTFHADAVIIPVRDLREAAASRLIIEQQSILSEAPNVCSLKTPWDVWGRVAGGAIYSLSQTDEERLLAVGFHHLVERLVRADIPIVFLHFPRFAVDGEYLFGALAPTLGQVTANMAREAFAKTAIPEKVRTTQELKAALTSNDVLLLQQQNAALKRENSMLRSRTLRARRHQAKRMLSSIQNFLLLRETRGAGRNVE